MSESTDAAAIKAAINAQFPSGHTTAVELDEVSGLTLNHILIFVSRRYTDVRRGGGSASMDGGRLVTRFIGRSVNDVREMRVRTRAALEDQILSGDVGPFVYEAEAEELRFDIEDGGWYVTADSYTY